MKKKHTWLTKKKSDNQEKKEKKEKNNANKNRHRQTISLIKGVNLEFNKNNNKTKSGSTGNLTVFRDKLVADIENEYSNIVDNDQEIIIPSYCSKDIVRVIAHFNKFFGNYDLTNEPNFGIFDEEMDTILSFLISHSKQGILAIDWLFEGPIM
eukprot:TRINITY_DN1095_c0_g1_i1.p1 TRINITY_DN1095_c0_g1~~TRINITY_DN1095_c0_g1_i1.p1  ORF type:complete len:153 (+),score=28.77 TRINITY_DN1095_c0_g1_i1:117-575(+)